MLNINIEMDMASEILKLLGHETRLTMLKILDDHDCCVCEFVEIFQATQPAISQHIRKLKDSGLIKEERRGQWIFYSLNKEYEHYDFLIKLLNLLPCQNEKLKKLELNGTRIQCN
ncbi:ArsR/SmtB family transcription factor [Pseudogracilibacillus sp. SO10305]|uniref:ArsR/SmtB family transcription factor n=1 Tax=Pseudogracilibacillus sp. SO10305 TaxID=3098292 RepID=UPI00300DEC99